MGEAAAGSFRIVVIRGPAGIGKSALVRAVLERADGFRVVAETCHEDVVGSTTFDVGGDRPVLLCVDDAHWAAEPTVEALRHVVSTALLASAHGPVRLCVVLAHRPGVGPVLQRMATEPGARVVDVSGLDELATNELITAVAPAPPSPALLASVREATGGNPLFVRLVADQAVVQDGQLVGPVGPLPADLDSALLAWVASVDTGPLLRAAVLGDGGRVADVDADLTELVDAGLLVVGPQTYAFGHPQLRHVVLRSAPPTVLRDVHLWAAEVLQRRRGSASAIADHLALGGRPDADRFVEGGDAAYALGAWATAARQYEAALAAGAGGAGIVIRAARAHSRNHDSRACVRRSQEAIELARGTDAAVWGEAVGLLVEAGFVHGAGVVGQTMDVDLVDEFLTTAPGVDDRQQAELLFLLAEAHYVGFDFATALSTAEVGLGAARASGDLVLIASLEAVIGFVHLARLDLEQAELHLRAGVEYAARADSPWRHAGALARAALCACIRGDALGALALAGRAADLIDSHGDWAEYSLAMSCRAAASAVVGRFDDAERFADTAHAAWLRSDYSFTPLVLFPALAWTRAARGDRAGLDAVLAEWDASGARGGWRIRALASATLGTPVAIAAAPPAAVDQFQLTAVGAAVEAAYATGTALDPAFAALLEDLHHRGVEMTVGWPMSVRRLLGLAAALDGDVAAAERWLRSAITEADRRSWSPEAGRARLDLARLRSDPALVLDAVSSFDRLGMMPFVASARALAAEINADLSAAPSVTRYVAVVRGAGVDEMRVHGGVPVGEQGAWFASANGAVRCGVGLAATSTAAVGIATTSEEAEAVCALAGRGEVIVTDEVAVATDGVGLIRLGAAALPVYLVSDAIGSRPAEGVGECR